MKEKEKEKLAFGEEDRQQLIDCYKEHPMLWNSQLKDYRNRDLRRVNSERFARQLDSRYSVETIQCCRRGGGRRGAEPPLYNFKGG